MYIFGLKSFSERKIYDVRMYIVVLKPSGKQANRLKKRFNQYKLPING